VLKLEHQLAGRIINSGPRVLSNQTHGHLPVWLAPSAPACAMCFVPYDLKLVAEGTHRSSNFRQAIRPANQFQVRLMRWVAPVSDDGESYCGLLSKQPSKGPSTMEITSIGLDLAKSVFQLHAADADADGTVVWHKRCGAEHSSRG